MSLQRITGQHRAKAQIAAWLTAERLPHSVLITGREGVGKRELAFELARAINCRIGTDACGECPSCLKTASLSHRDVHALLPLPTGTNRSDEVMIAEMREAALGYLEQHTSLKHSNSNIPRDYIRLLHREMSYAPAEGRRRIGIIFEADCMQPAGANSLLKILEEPPRHAVFLLVSSSPHLLLPTVVSRCQRLDLRPLSTAELTKRLRERGVDQGRAELAARIGAGSVRRADAVIDRAAEFEERRNRVERFLQAGFQQEDGAYWAALEELGARADRGQLDSFLEICGVYLRDLFLMGQGRAENVTNADRIPWLQGQLRALNLRALEVSAERLDRAYADLHGNINVQLLLAEFWQSLRRCARAPRQ